MVDVVDGDSIWVEIAGQMYELRYIGIDAPEAAWSGGQAEPLADEASEANRRLVGGQVVFLEKDVSEVDKFGRLLRYVWIDDMMVNAELVRQGLARAVAYAPDVKYEPLLEQAQAEAQEARRGIWGLATSEPASNPQVTIVDLQFRGKDEYVEIRNDGQSLDMTGWSLISVRGYQVFYFPEGFILGAGASVRVHTGPGAFDNPPADLFWSDKFTWNNDGDKAELYDARGRLVAMSEY